MKFAAAHLHRLRWLNVPGALLIVLLQRTPVLRLLVAAEEAVIASPIGTVLRSAAVALGSLGALDAIAGPTTFLLRQNNTDFVRYDDPPRTSIPINLPIPLTVGTAIVPIVFTVTGGPTPAGSYQIANLPPGLTLNGANASGLLNASSGVITGTPTSAGSFTTTLRAYEFAGGSASNPPTSAFPADGPILLTFTITGAANVAPTITTQPVGQVVAPGANVTFSVSATGSPAPAYQWQRDGTNLPGATNASLPLTGVQTSDAGDYRVIVSNVAGNVASNPATLSVVSANSDARLSNLSVRTAMAASQTLIVGVTVGGGAQQVLVRAAGPALAAFGLGNAMIDPRLDLFSGSALVLSNDNWDVALRPTFAGVGAFDFQTGSRDAALVQSLNAGYTVQARGTGAGVVLVEAYDLGTGGAGRLINVSARNFCGTGDNILIAGFNVAGSGTGAKRLLIRAVGPKLASFGVSGFLADPKLEIFSGATKLNENDNWDASLAPTFTAVGAFSLDAGSRDAALLTLLPPGSYTVQVRGADGGTGEALVEIYEVP